MEYVLIAVEQTANMRHFAFKGTSADKQRLLFRVDVDMTALRAHGIAMQELPLLCRRLLEEKPVLEQTRRSLFSESRMAEYARLRDAERDEAAQRRKNYAKPARAAAGSV